MEDQEGGVLVVLSYNRENCDEYHLFKFEE